MMRNKYCSLILPALLGVNSLAITGVWAETLHPVDVALADGNVLGVAEIRLPQKTLEPAIAWDLKYHGLTIRVLHR